MIPFGRMIGLGTVIIGAALVLFGGLSFLATVVKSEILTFVGVFVLSGGIVVGIALSFYAMIKYNKGIF